MSLSQKSQALLDRAVEQIAKDGGRIWGFIVTLADDQPEMSPFSSHPDSPEKFVEMTAAAAKAMYEQDIKEGANAVN